MSRATLAKTRIVNETGHPVDTDIFDVATGEKRRDVKHLAIAIDRGEITATATLMYAAVNLYLESVEVNGEQWGEIRSWCVPLGKEAAAEAALKAVGCYQL